MSMMSSLLRQCRKPAGWLGRFVARGMNISHSEMTDWGAESHLHREKRYDP